MKVMLSLEGKQELITKIIDKYMPSGLKSKIQYCYNEQRETYYVKGELFHLYREEDTEWQFTKTKSRWIPVFLLPKKKTLVTFYREKVYREDYFMLTITLNANKNGDIAVKSYDEIMDDTAIKVAQELEPILSKDSIVELGLNSYKKLDDKYKTEMKVLPNDL